MSKGSEFQVPDKKVIPKRIPYLIKQAQEVYTKQFEEALADNYVFRHVCEAVNDTFFTGPKRDRRAQDNIYLWGPRVYALLSVNGQKNQRDLPFKICFEREDTLSLAARNEILSKIGFIYLPNECEEYRKISDFLDTPKWNLYPIAWDFRNNKIVGTEGIRKLLNEIPRQ